MTSRKEIARLEQLVRDGHLDRVEYDQVGKYFTVTRNAAGGVDTVAESLDPFRQSLIDAGYTLQQVKDAERKLLAISGR